MSRTSVTDRRRRAQMRYRAVLNAIGYLVVAGGIAAVLLSL